MTGPWRTNVSNNKAQKVTADLKIGITILSYFWYQLNFSGATPLITVSDAIQRDARQKKILDAIFRPASLRFPNLVSETTTRACATDESKARARPIYRQ
jgi:hypothetical protein